MALIIAGRNTTDSLASVEIFGCPHLESFEVASLPFPLDNPGGLFDEAEGRVLVCGGYGCDPEVACDSTKKCHYFKPDTDEWRRAMDMRIGKNNFLMTKIGNINETSASEKVISSLGYTTQSDIYDPYLMEFKEYLDFPSPNIYTSTCIVQIGDLIVALRQDIVILDTLTWNMTIYQELPFELWYSR